MGLHRRKPSKTLAIDKSKVLELTSKDTRVVVLTKSVNDYESKKYKSMKVIHNRNIMEDMNNFIEVINSIKDGNYLIKIDGFSDYFNNPELSQKIE